MGYKVDFRVVLLKRLETSELYVCCRLGRYLYEVHIFPKKPQVRCIIYGASREYIVFDISYETKTAIYR